MASDKIQYSLKAETRESFKKRANKEREKGFIPAVLYGPKTKNISLFLNSKEFEDIFREAGESSIINLEIEGKKAKTPVLIHDIQRDSVTSKVIHTDLYQPDLEKEVIALVPLIIKGEAPAVKKGGTLLRSFHELEVKALPLNLPHEIEVDVSNLEEFHDEVLIKDLKVSEGAKILRGEKEVVISIAGPSRAVEELEKIEEATEEIEEPELVGKEEAEEEKEESKE